MHTRVLQQRLIENVHRENIDGLVSIKLNRSKFGNNFYTQYPYN